MNSSKSILMHSLAAFNAAQQTAVWCDRSGRVRFEIAGPDRARFLHNLTTSDLKRLPVGRGCEAFVTSLQGRTLAYVKVLACHDSILICTDPGGLVLALPHFQKYGVFDEVVLEDRSETTFEYHLLGPKAEELIIRAGGQLPEPGELAHAATNLADCPLLIVRESPTGRPGLTLIGGRGSGGRVAGHLQSIGHELGLEKLDDESYEVLRIEAGTPVFGRDVTERNFPQEIGRDDRAINFVKGCYLGQETVARIDALGHVNQILKGLQLEPDAPGAEPGSVLEADGAHAGFVTSSAVSPGWKRAIALAMVRTSLARPGVRLVVKGKGDEATALVRATVCDLPMIPPPGAVPPH
jgi:tRNA-modifying protein YgfZ